MFGNDRSQLRQMFFDSWKKYKEKNELEPLQKIICQIILMHPEYHTFLDNPANLEKEFLTEQGDGNPFLHMAMHISIHEQLSSDRPEGIVTLHNLLINKIVDPHRVEHKMMDCLSEMIWQSQQTSMPPDDQHYLKCLNSIATN